MIQVISPISLKLGQFKVSILKLRILKWLTAWDFPGEDRAPPYFFNWEGQIMSCHKHQKQKAAVRR